MISYRSIITPYQLEAYQKNLEQIRIRESVNENLGKIEIKDDHPINEDVLQVVPEYIRYQVNFKENSFQFKFKKH